MKLLAQGFIGKISPPPGSGAFTGDPIAALGTLLGKFINIFIVLAGLVMLIYMLWGALDWITSNGEKDKIQKAQNKITNAALGIFIIIGVLVIWGYVAGDLFGIIKRTSNGWTINIPTL